MPAEYAPKVAELRVKLIEAASNFDDALADKFLNEEEITTEEIKIGLRKGTILQKVTPAFCGTAFKNKGVQLVLDGVVDYLPSPLDVPPLMGMVPNSDKKVEITPDPNGKFYALAFKIMTDPFVGSLTFTRIYSGSLKSGSYIYNARTGNQERVSRLLKMHANKREEISSAHAGDIVAIVGVKDVSTGDTLCEENSIALLESITVPTPVIAMSVEPKSKADYEKMGISLRKMMQEDPSFRFSFNEETGQTIIEGMGELHLRNRS